jgi:hypothetical protein
MTKDDVSLEIARMGGKATWQRRLKSRDRRQIEKSYGMLYYMTGFAFKLFFPPFSIVDLVMQEHFILSEASHHLKPFCKTKCKSAILWSQTVWFFLDLTIKQIKFSIKDFTIYFDINSKI